MIFHAFQDLQLSSLGFGTMRLPLLADGSIDMADVDRMVDTAIASGINYFDTAYPYHEGNSETAIGKSLSRYPRESWYLADKFPGHQNVPGVTPLDPEEVFEAQLKKCGVEYFDYYMLHNLGRLFESLEKELGSMKFIARKKAEGKIKRIGISCHDNSEFLESVLKRYPEIEFVQIQLNYLDWEDEGIDSKRSLEVCAKYNKPVIVMEPVKGGNLINIPADAEKLFKNHDPNASTASWALRFAASQNNVMTVLSGVSNVEQMNDNLKTMKDFRPLNAEELGIVGEAAAIIRKAVVIPCTNCQYCVHACPNGIPIPLYFTLYNADKRANVPGFSPQMVYYQNLGEKYPKASECVECGECEDACPQHI
ncbi:MAG: aldo/keto reductase, partial [Oscillospiraceae bacterium]|nr:aldo/keto reductase [Oscillospiraceae bacterium]